MARRRRRRSRRRRGGLPRWVMLAALALLAGWLHRAGYRFDSLLETLPSIERPDLDPSSGSAGATYDRHAWPHWSDADGDCQDTRQEVLVAESEVPVTFHSSRRCRVKRGRWRCPYTGRTFTDPHDLDVDHLVPLAEAHRSGGHAWDRARRERYANALEHPDHLVAVQAGANRAKGDKGPDAWMPEAAGYRCAYLEAWRGVKARWRLEMDPVELRYVEQAEQACARGEVPALPSRSPPR